MEDLLGAFRLPSGCGFQRSLLRFAELDGEHTLEDLREAFARLSKRRIFDEHMQQQIDEMAENGELDELIEQLIERMEQEDYISKQRAARSLSAIERAGTSGRCGVAGAIRSDRQEPRLSGIQDAARSAWIAGQIELRPPRHAAWRPALKPAAPPAYEFGDTLNLDTTATLKSAIAREGIRCRSTSSTATCRCISASTSVRARPCSCWIARTR